MQVEGKHYRTIWLKDAEPHIVQIIDQTVLPHRFVIIDLHSVEEIAHAIKSMQVRGAGLIGATAAYGMYLAAIEAISKGKNYEVLTKSASLLRSTRPTAVNLAWAVNKMLQALEENWGQPDFITCARQSAHAIADEDAAACQQIASYGKELLCDIYIRKGEKPLNILTHCNAGWLAFVDYGTALSPIYSAFDAGIPVHVWVDETRPSNQGARLTAWELKQQGVPHTIIADNVGGHLMQHGQVDLVIVGADRITRTGDTANKIGTYLKALAAKDCSVPFFVAATIATLDGSLTDGIKKIPIEERHADEVSSIEGWAEDKLTTVRLTPQGSPAKNFGFDVTPHRLITGVITERGIFKPEDLTALMV